MEKSNKFSIMTNSDLVKNQISRNESSEQNEKELSGFNDNSNSVISEHNVTTEPR